MLSPIYCFLLKIFRISHFTSLLFFTLFSFYQLVSAELEEVTHKDTAAIRHIPCEICPSLSYIEHGWKPIEPLAPLQNQTHVTVVIDVFRAFTTASYILEFNPATYIITTKTDVISQLARELPNILVIGKPEKGADFTYDIPNSPTRVQGVNVTGLNVLHRTEAGAKGILLAWDADIILAAGFVNAKATAQYIRTLINPKVKIVPMGHESTTPSLEDDVGAQYIELCPKVVFRIKRRFFDLRFFEQFH
jgi:hypothetical protein